MWIIRLFLAGAHNWAMIICVKYGWNAQIFATEPEEEHIKFIVRLGVLVSEYE